MYNNDLDILKSVSEKYLEEVAAYTPPPQVPAEVRPQPAQKQKNPGVQMTQKSNPGTNPNEQGTPISVARLAKMKGKEKMKRHKQWVKPVASPPQTSIKLEAYLEEIKAKAPFMANSWHGETDIAKTDMCGLNPMKYHPGAVAAWEEAGFKIPDCAK